MNSNSKVIIVKNQTKELEKMLNDGYKIVGAYPYVQGLLMVLQK